MHKWPVDKPGTVSLYTSVSQPLETLDNDPRRPKHVRDKLETERGFS